MLTFKFIVSAVAVLAVCASVFLAYSNWKYSGRLAEQRALVQSYIDEAKAANAESARAQIAAEESEARADSAEAQAALHAWKARESQARLAAIRAAVPADADTLTKLAAEIAAARQEREVAAVVADEWRLAYESQLKATAELRAANARLSGALDGELDASTQLQGGAKRLIESSGESFWKRLVPKLHVGATAGVNPQGKFDAVVGAGLGWTI